jgi:thiol-disulfide isomerase/thioredoxin
MKSCFRIGAFLLAAVVAAQQPSKEDEQKELNAALAEAGNSPVEFIRALERHLEKHPNSGQKDEIERALVKAAMEVRDERRTLLYGERVLEKTPDQPQILERVTRLLLDKEDKDSNERAQRYARQFEELLRTLEKEGPSGSRNKAQMLEELDRALGRALVFQARAAGNLGDAEKAAALASRAWEQRPSAESAREIGRWLAKAGKPMEAVRHYADAFTIADPNSTDIDRAKDRAKMGELYRQVKGSEAGLGDLVLESYDRMAATTGQRLAEVRKRDPNAELTNPMEFTITGVDGGKLELASLRGKVVVMDFWATWCGPCRVQHPLYEQVKKRFAGYDGVVFLAINTDEDQSAVAPFLESVKWGKTGYFEDGLSNLLRITSIPTTIIMDRDGKVFTRLNGFLPDRFVDQLTARIREALTAK